MQARSNQLPLSFRALIRADLPAQVKGNALDLISIPPDARATSDLIPDLMTFLNEHPEIDTLNITGEALVNYAAISQLIQCTSITALIIHTSVLDVACMTLLATSKTLRLLSALGCGIKAEGAIALAINQSITELNLSCNNIGSAGAIALAGNTTLQLLRLASCNIEAAGVIALAANSNLISLNLNCNVFTLPSAEALARNTTLRQLELRACELSADCISVLARKNTTLVSLDLSYNHAFRDSINAFRHHNKTITHLRVEANGLTTQDVCHLIDMPSITWLDVDENNIDDEAAFAAAANPRLKTFKASYCNLNERGLLALATSRSITELYIAGNNYTPAVMLALAANKNLQQLACCYTGYLVASPEQREAIDMAFRANTTLVKVLLINLHAYIDMNIFEKMRATFARYTHRNRLMKEHPEFAHFIMRAECEAGFYTKGVPYFTPPLAVDKPVAAAASAVASLRCLTSTSLFFNAGKNGLSSFATIKSEIPKDISDYVLQMEALKTELEEKNKFIPTPVAQPAQRAALTPFNRPITLTSMRDRRIAEVLTARLKKPQELQEPPSSPIARPPAGKKKYAPPAKTRQSPQKNIHQHILFGFGIGLLCSSCLLLPTSKGAILGGLLIGSLITALGVAAGISVLVLAVVTIMAIAGWLHYRSEKQPTPALKNSSALQQRSSYYSPPPTRAASLTPALPVPKIPAAVVDNGAGLVPPPRLAP